MPRRRKGEAEKVRATFTLSPELVRALQIVNEDTDIPMSRIVERAAWEWISQNEPKSFMRVWTELQRKPKEYGEAEAIITRNPDMMRLMVERIERAFAKPGDPPDGQDTTSGPSGTE